MLISQNGRFQAKIVLNFDFCVISYKMQHD